jgi:hypothetical protein
MYYLNAFQGSFSFVLHSSKPTNLIVAKINSKDIDENSNISWKPNVLNHLRAKIDHKPK